MISLVDRIWRKWMNFRLQPIHVYCLHHVCEHFDAESMDEEDWMALEDFKMKLMAMRQSCVQFISLSDAHRLLNATSTPYTIHHIP